MVRHAKDFLHEHKATAPGTIWYGMVDGNLRAVRHCHPNHFTHLGLLSCRISRVFDCRATPVCTTRTSL
jgi:hypothetical protein